MANHQLANWTGTFGDAYIERNAATQKSVGLALKKWSNLLLQFHGANLNSILEVGSNIGLNLRALKLLTDAELFAVEPNEKAVEILAADNVLPASHVSLADACNIPHKSNSFDLVFTSGVLIHISPENLPVAYKEIHRVSNRFILSIEYFSEQPMEIPYRGHSNLLFKRDFGLLWKETFPELAIRGSGFFWRPETGLDNLTWWLFEKI
jgi:pseudaminic acid biosynthesis-associated methylase